MERIKVKLKKIIIIRIIFFKYIFFLFPVFFDLVIFIIAHKILICISIFIYFEDFEDNYSFALINKSIL